MIRSRRSSRSSRSTRLGMVVGLLAVGLLWSPVAATAQGGPGWEKNWGSPPADTPAEPSPTPVQQPAGYLWWSVSSIGTEEEFGERCWRIVAERRDEPPTAGRTREAAAELLAEWDVSGVALEACPVVVSPAVAALELWVSMQVGGAEPSIAPGWALTGMPAFLELGGALDERTASTSAGGVTIQIRAWAEHLVDWGDGTPPVPATSSGVSWREGTGHPDAITHVYTDAAAQRTVTVTTRWRAEFTAPGVRQDLPVREVVATLDLPVREVQAVRTRG